MLLGDCICACGSPDSGNMDYFEFPAGTGLAFVPWSGTA